MDSQDVAETSWIKRISITLSGSKPDASLGIRLRRRAIYTASKPASGLTTLSIAGIVIAALYFARDIFIPLALAILLTFALGPLVNRLRRLHFGAIPSVICVVLLAFLAIAGGSAR